MIEGKIVGCGDQLNREYKRIYSKYYNRLVDLAKSRGCRDPENMVQSLFTKLFANEHIGSDGQKVSFAYLSKALYRLGIDQHRATHGRQNQTAVEIVDYDEVEKWTPDSGLVGGDPAERVEQREELEKTLKYIERLPPRRRQALTLYIQGKTYSEISVEMKASIGDVAALISQARDSLEMKTER